MAQLCHTEKYNIINIRNSADVQWPTILTGISFNPVFYWAVNQTIVQRA
ncbi:hypothetical protein ACQJ0J_10740 [Bacillus subtilis]